MKICLCVSWYFPESIGGTETYVHALALFLKNNGHHVTLLKPGRQNQPTYFYDSIEVINFYPGKNFSKAMYAGLEAPMLDDFEAKLRAIGPDIVHFHSLTGPAGITLFHIKKARQVADKVFFTFHLPHLTCATSTFRYLKKYDCNGVAEPARCAACLFAHSGWPARAAKLLGGFSTLLDKGGVKVLGVNPVLTRLGSAEWIGLRIDQLQQLSRYCDKLICLSSWFHEVLKKNNVSSASIAFIPQGLPMYATDFISKKKEIIPPSEPLRLVFLGRLNPIKGLSLLLSVINEFDPADFILDLYGPAEEKYLQQLQAYFKKQNIRYKGLLQHKDVLPVLSAYHAMILPSIVTEMAPLVLQEAFAAGIPVIASDVAGNAAFITPNVNGWLFKNGNKASLKEILSQLLRNKGELTTMSSQLPSVRTITNIGNEHLELYLN